MDQGRSYRRTVLLITSIGAMMAPLDSTIVSVSLPTMASDLNMDYASIIWVPTAYLVALAVLILSVGRLSDIRGRKPIFITGFIVFVIGSFLCSIAQSGNELILFRIVQGVGAAFFGATSAAIITDVFPREERGKALGINAMAVYIGLALGPPLGGVLTAAFGWRSIFYINIPIGIVVAAMAYYYIHENAATRRKERFDLRGLFTFSIGLISLLVALTLGEQWGWTSAGIIVLAVLAVVFLGLFILVERRLGSKAMFDLSLITRNRLFAAANISALLNYISYFGVSLILSFYLQRVLGLSVLETGGVLLVMPVTMAVLSPLSGLLSDRIGSRLLASAGMFIIAAGLVLLSLLGVDSSTVLVGIGLFVIGLGMGLFASPNTSAVMGCVPKSQLGVASGTLATMRFVGQATSLAVMGAIVATVASTAIVSSLFTGLDVGSIQIASQDFVDGMRIAFLVSAAIAVVGGITSLARGPSFSDEGGPCPVEPQRH
ncbi:MAG: MFS transporter [Methanomassiliicoccales archaeon]|nr:MFS transporter [Methanomassiliicoccales archaeon]